MKTKSLTLVIGILFLMAGSAMAQQGPGGRGRGGRGGPPPGRGGQGPGRGSPQQGPGGSQRLADELDLNNQQQNEVRAALNAYDQTIRQQTQQARNDLLARVQSVLSEDQLSRLKDDLQQIPLVPNVPQQLRGVATNDLVDRVLAFDKNNDGMITKDELPDRMANLLDQGDTNHDGALDKSELTNLAAQNGVDNQPPGRGGRGGPGGRRGGGPPQGGFGQQGA